MCALSCVSYSVSGDTHHNSLRHRYRFCSCHAKNSGQSVSFKCSSNTCDVTDRICTSRLCKTCSKLADVRNKNWKHGKNCPNRVHSSFTKNSVDHKEKRENAKNVGSGPKPCNIDQTKLQEQKEKMEKWIKENAENKAKEADKNSHAKIATRKSSGNQHTISRIGRTYVKGNASILYNMALKRGNVGSDTSDSDSEKPPLKMTKPRHKRLDRIALHNSAKFTSRKLQNTQESEDKDAATDNNPVVHVGKYNRPVQRQNVLPKIGYHFPNTVEAQTSQKLSDILEVLDKNGGPKVRISAENIDEMFDGYASTDSESSEASTLCESDSEPESVIQKEDRKAPAETKQSSDASRDEESYEGKKRERLPSICIESDSGVEVLFEGTPDQQENQDTSNDSLSEAKSAEETDTMIDDVGEGRSHPEKDSDSSAKHRTEPGSILESSILETDADSPECQMVVPDVIESQSGVEDDNTATNSIPADGNGIQMDNTSSESNADHNNPSVSKHSGCEGQTPIGRREKSIVGPAGVFPLSVKQGQDYCSSALEGQTHNSRTSDGEYDSHLDRTSRSDSCCEDEEMENVLTRGSSATIEGAQSLTQQEGNIPAAIKHGPEEGCKARASQSRGNGICKSAIPAERKSSPDCEARHEGKADWNSKQRDHKANGPGNDWCRKQGKTVPFDKCSGDENHCHNIIKDSQLQWSNEESASYQAHQDINCRGPCETRLVVYGDAVLSQLDVDRSVIRWLDFGCERDRFTEQETNYDTKPEKDELLKAREEGSEERSMNGGFQPRIFDGTPRTADANEEDPTASSETRDRGGSDVDWMGCTSVNEPTGTTNDEGLRRIDQATTRATNGAQHACIAQSTGPMTYYINGDCKSIEDQYISHKTSANHHYEGGSDLEDGAGASGLPACAGKRPSNTASPETETEPNGRNGPQHKSSVPRPEQAQSVLQSELNCNELAELQQRCKSTANSSEAKAALDECQRDLEIVHAIEMEDCDHNYKQNSGDHTSMPDAEIPNGMITHLEQIEGDHDGSTTVDDKGDVIDKARVLVKGTNENGPSRAVEAGAVHADSDLSLSGSRQNESQPNLSRAQGTVSDERGNESTVAEDRPEVTREPTDAGQVSRAWGGALPSERSKRAAKLPMQNSKIRVSHRQRAEVDAGRSRNGMDSDGRCSAGAAMMDPTVTYSRDELGECVPQANEINTDASGRDTRTDDSTPGSGTEVLNLHHSCGRSLDFDESFTNEKKTHLEDSKPGSSAPFDSGAKVTNEPFMTPRQRHSPKREKGEAKKYDDVSQEPMMQGTTDLKGAINVHSVDEGKSETTDSGSHSWANATSSEIDGSTGPTPCANTSITCKPGRRGDGPWAEATGNMFPHMSQDLAAESHQMEDKLKANDTKLFTSAADEESGCLETGAESWRSETPDDRMRHASAAQSDFQITSSDRIKDKLDRKQDGRSAVEESCLHPWDFDLPPQPPCSPRHAPSDKRQRTRTEGHLTSHPSATSGAQEARLPDHLRDGSGAKSWSSRAQDGCPANERPAEANTSRRFSQGDQ